VKTPQVNGLFQPAEKGIVTVCSWKADPDTEK